MALIAGCGAPQKPKPPPIPHPGPEVSARWLALPVAEVLARHLEVSVEAVGVYVYPAGVDGVPSDPVRVRGIAYYDACGKLGAVDCFPLWVRNAPAGHRILVVSAIRERSETHHGLRWLPWTVLRPAADALRARLDPAAAAADPDLLALEYLIAHGAQASAVLWLDTASAAPVVHPAIPKALLVDLRAQDPQPRLEKRADVPLPTFGTIDGESFEQWRRGLVGDQWSIDDPRLTAAPDVERAVLRVGTIATRLRVRPLANGFLIDRPYYYIGECTAGPTMETRVFVGDREFTVANRGDIDDLPKCR